jgi:hypothetical protein
MFVICDILIPWLAFCFGVGLGLRTTQLILGTRTVAHHERRYGVGHYPFIPPRRYWRRK